MNKYVQVQDVDMAFDTKRGTFVALSGVDASVFARRTDAHCARSREHGCHGDA